MMERSNFDWFRFHAYRVFDEFLQRLVLERKSYITRHVKELEFEAAFNEIHSVFSEGYDDSNETFDNKVERQFADASENSKIVFANVEYLWAMPIQNIRPSTKQSYVARWFDKNNEVNTGERFFFETPHTIANAGIWYLQNKYWELIALFRVLSIVTNSNGITDLSSTKKQIAEVCYSAIYEGGARQGRFAVTKVCSVHSALMHLSDPEKFESIISENHKRRIANVFEHVISDRPDIVCREEKIRLIRERLYGDYGDEGHPDRKYRWFFYQDSIKSLWLNKKSTSQQENASIDDEVNRELAALEYTEEEGQKQATTAYRIYRSVKLAAEVKRRDGFKCRACGFSFKKQIVHVHHLDPLSERLSPKKTAPEDLVTLCPNCHYLAHYWLRKSDRYKNLEELLKKLQSSLRVLSAGEYV
ncbi:MAG: HNH endonuclease [Candidatus Thiodiazotropha endolucinida]